MGVFGSWDVLVTTHLRNTTHAWRRDIPDILLPRRVLRTRDSTTSMGSLTIPFLMSRPLRGCNLPPLRSNTIPIASVNYTKNQAGVVCEDEALLTIEHNAIKPLHTDQRTVSHGK